MSFVYSSGMLSAMPVFTCNYTIFAGNGEAVLAGLLQSFDNPNHIASDTAFLFPDGEVLLASRSILATQCNKMIPMLYSSEGTAEPTYTSTHLSLARSQNQIFW